MHQSAPKRKQPAPRPVVKDNAVTGTVDTTPVMSTPTSTSDVVGKDRENDDSYRGREAPYIDEDISDCI